MHTVKTISDFSEDLTKGKKREKAILECAIDAFVQYGYRGTSLDKIIKGSGGSRSTVYSAYGSKKGLFQAVIATIVEDVYSQYTEHYDESRPWEDELIIFGNIFLKNILTPRSIGLSRLIFSEAPHFPEIGNWFYANGIDLSYLCFAKVLENNIDLPLEQLKKISMYYIELLKANLYLHCLCDPNFHPGEVEIEEEVRSCAEIFKKHIQFQISLHKG